MSTAPRPQLLPRLIRLRDALFYLGMDRNRFNKGSEQRDAEKAAHYALWLAETYEGADGK